MLSRITCYVLLGASSQLPLLYAHSNPIHEKITRAAVEYLKAHDRTHDYCVPALVALLQEGIAAEDKRPRSMFHFLPRLDNVVASLWPVSATCSSLDWGFSNDPCTQNGRPAFEGMRWRLFRSTHRNSYTWDTALQQARDRNGEGWHNLGYLLHLLEDLGVPAHTRNDPHWKFLFRDPFEEENRDRQSLPPTPPAGLIARPHAKQFFALLADYTRSNFFSKNTVFRPPGPEAVSQDSQYFYDLRGRKIARKAPSYDRTKRATIDRTIAREQFDELYPIIVRIAASFLKHYVDTASPFIPLCEP